MEPRETQANGRTASSNVPKVSPLIVSIPFVVIICLFTSDVLQAPDMRWASVLLRVGYQSNKSKYCAPDLCFRRPACLCCPGNRYGTHLRQTSPKTMLRTPPSG
jgi:hypothetical protein